MEQQLLTIYQAAQYLGVSTKTLIRWEQKGVLAPQRTIGNQRRYTIQELDAFKEKYKGTPTTPLPASATPPELQAGLPEDATQETIPTSTPAPVMPQPVQATLLTKKNEEKTTTVPTPAPELKSYVPGIIHPEDVLPKTTPQPQSEQSPVPQMMYRKSFMQSLVFALVGLFIAGGLTAVLAFFPQVGNLLRSTAEPESFTEESASTRSQPLTNLKIPTILGELTFNIPSIFNDTVTINKEFVVNGKSLFNEDITVNNKNVDLGTGELTASNVVYGLTAGANVTITGDPQNPVISAGVTGGVDSIQGQSGALTLSQGSGIGLSGLTITNTGVLSLGGQTGNVTLSGGTGVSVSGTTISNSDTGSAQNIFKTVVVDGSSILAGSNSDTLTFTAGSGIVLTPDTSTKTITITSNASGTLSGLTTNGVLYATSATSATSTAPGTNGYILRSNGAGSPPDWVAPGTVLGTVAFDIIASGTNTSATMVVGSGASLNFTGSGTINASSLLGSTWAAPGAIGSTTANSGAFTTVTGSSFNGLTVTNTGSNTLTIANGKTFTANNSLTLAGTDSTTFTFPSGSGTVVTTDAAQTLTNKTITAGLNTITGLTNSNLSGTAGISNANLANSSLTVTAGAGLSGGGAVSLGGSVALSNAGVTSLTGNANQVTVSAGTGDVTLSLPQNIHTGASPTFTGLTLSALTTNGGVI